MQVVQYTILNTSLLLGGGGGTKKSHLQEIVSYRVIPLIIRLIDLEFVQNVRVTTNSGIVAGYC